MYIKLMFFFVGGGGPKSTAKTDGGHCRIVPPPGSATGSGLRRSLLPFNFHYSEQSALSTISLYINYKTQIKASNDC